MSLQDANTVNTTATAFSQLWANWLTPAGAGAAAAATRKAGRETRISNIVHGFNTFLHPPNVVFPGLAGQFGNFSWPVWRLSVDSSMTSNDAISFGDFMELCRTIYHESRHCEQVYRCAQGLAARTIAFPDTTDEEIAQIAGQVGGGGVATRVAAFSGQGLNQAPVRVELIRRKLNIPTAAAQAADNNSAGFAAFVALAKPAWFKRATIQLEVEEWLRSLTKATLYGFTMWVETHGGSTQRTYDMYRDLPVELDAHGIEDTIASATENAIGRTVAAHAAHLRTAGV